VARVKINPFGSKEAVILEDSAILPSARLIFLRPKPGGKALSADGFGKYRQGARTVTELGRGGVRKTLTIADRLVIALINRQQLGPASFVVRDGGAVELTADGRKALVQAYVARKREEVTHPLLDTKVRVGQLPFLQAKLLARHLRGDAEGYPPCILR
jgi:hypothetical protein